MSEPLHENQPIAPQAPEPEPQEPEVQYAQIPQDEYDQLRSQLEQLAPLAEYIQQLPGEPAQPQQPEGQPQAQLDPFADDFQQQLDQYIDQRISPLQQYTQEQQMAEASEKAKDIIADYAAEKGYEFMDESSPERALILANHYVADEAEKYGMGTQAVEAAIARAADEVHAWEESVGKAYHDQQTNEVRTITGAPRQPDTPTAPQALPSIAAPSGGPFKVLEKYFPGA